MNNFRTVEKKEFLGEDGFEYTEDNITSRTLHHARAGARSITCELHGKDWHLEATYHQRIEVTLKAVRR